jgi:chloramphenicol O-acetyltransferase
VTNARRSLAEDSVPKIIFGKYEVEGGRVRLPVSVEVHHALMDGVHVGRYFERLQEHFTAPAAVLGGGADALPGAAAPPTVDPS